MSVLRRMTGPEYAIWLAETVPAYAEDKVAAGQWAADDALALSRQEYEELLPQGMATADNHFFSIVDAQSAIVGMLWFAVTTKFNSRVAYVFDVGVKPEHQRQGHAYRAFQEVEGQVQALGLAGIALHVFGHNAGARALYAKLGYGPTNISLYKALSATQASPSNNHTSTGSPAATEP
jgi:ribosomal protein S18 acetylase RimI-like enzyme